MQGSCYGVSAMLTSGKMTEGGVRTQMARSNHSARKAKREARKAKREAKKAERELRKLERELRKLRRL